MARPHALEIGRDGVGQLQCSQRIPRCRKIDYHCVPTTFVDEPGHLVQSQQLLDTREPHQLLRLDRAETHAVFVACRSHRQHRTQTAVPLFEQPRGIDLDDVQVPSNRSDARVLVGVTLCAEGVAERVRLVEGGNQHLPARGRERKTRCRRQGGLPRATFADEQRYRGAGFGASVGQPSTRFFNSLSAVSVMTFSALRLNRPIIGMFRSTVSSYVTSVPLPVSRSEYDPF